MATNTVNGSLWTSGGAEIPLKAEIAEGTETEITTDTTFTVTAQSVGDYAPGQTITHGLVAADNGISYAYLLRQGVVQSIIPVCIKGTSFDTPALFKPVRLQAGDKIQVLTTTGATRQAALMVATNRGIERIFTVTPSGAATNSLTDLQTGNSIGDTLQGQTVVSAAFTTIDALKIESPSGGAVIVNNLNNVVGSVPSTSPGVIQPFMKPVRAPVALNYVAQFVTNA